MTAQYDIFAACAMPECVWRQRLLLRSVVQNCTYRQVDRPLLLYLCNNMITKANAETKLTCSCCCTAGLAQLQDLNLHECRNVATVPGDALPLLLHLAALTSLNLRNCEGLQSEALCSSALAGLHQLDVSGKLVCWDFRILLCYKPVHYSGQI